jgi:hypothetical protein
MAIIPQTPISPLRLLNVPQVPPHPETHLNLPSSSTDAPSQWEEPRGAGQSFQEAFDRDRFSNSLSALFNLVFELRQEVADLQFRMQTTETKVASFLHIIASMQRALLSDPVAVHKGEEQNRGPAQADMQQTEREDYTGEAADDKEADMRWDAEPVHTEEEPGPGDLQPMQPHHSPGV